MKKTDLLKLIVYFNKQASNTVKQSQNLSFKTQSQNQIQLNSTRKKNSFSFEFNISCKLKHCRRETLPKLVTMEVNPYVHKIWCEKYGLKYGCGALGCMKLFHSLEFVKKHLTLKHPDLMSGTGTEASNSHWQGSDPKLAEALEPYVHKVWIEECGWMYGCQAEGCMMKLWFHSSAFLLKHLRWEHPDLLTMSEVQVLEGSEYNSAEDAEEIVDRWQERLDSYVHRIWSEKSGLKYGCGACLNQFHSLASVEKHLNMEHPDLMSETEGTEASNSHWQGSDPKLAEALEPYDTGDKLEAVEVEEIEAAHPQFCSNMLVQERCGMKPN